MSLVTFITYYSQYYAGIKCTGLYIEEITDKYILKRLKPLLQGEMNEKFVLLSKVHKLSLFAYEALP